MFKISAIADEISPKLADQLDLLSSENIDYIELRSVNDKNMLDQDADELRQIKKQLDEKNIKVSAISSPIGKIKITDDFEPHIERFRHALEVAGAFNTKYIRIFSYYIPDGEKFEKYTNDVICRMKEKTKLAEKAGIILGLENENVYGDTPERCIELVKAVNSPNLKIIFDPGNITYFLGTKAYPDAYNVLADFTAYLHIKDGKYDKSFVLPGKGDSGIKEILTDLQKRNFDGFLSLEPHLVSGNSTGGFTGPDNFRSAIKELKNLIKTI
ncbi:MAG: hypothetical protein A3J83_01430 [Elusimicrobia bacterium RIFOXYA2_FULL_40_6]|nr:MAG: hypothetical protein A3J83_01430 [Elusimicrobia bacterium RIFOXYA2_FULL_40_6]